MNMHAAVDPKWLGLAHPNGDPLHLNNKNFVAIDRNRDASYEPTYRPQALYNRANQGFHANNETFLLHEVSTNLPIYRPDTGPTDFPPRRPGRRRSPRSDAPPCRTVLPDHGAKTGLTWD